MAEGKSRSSGSSGGQGDSGDKAQEAQRQQAQREQAQREQSDQSQGQGDPSREEIATRDDATTPTGEDSPGVRKDPDGTLVPVENAPGPEPVDDPTVRAVDTRPRLEPKDRATYVGAVHLRHPDIDVPEEFQLFASSDGERDEEAVELDGQAVDVFQVITTTHHAVFRFDGQTFVLNGEQSRAFMADARGALTNVVA
jgi:hypothetical protein